MHNYKYFLRDNSKNMTKSLALDVIKKAVLTEKSSGLTKNQYITLLVGLQYNKCDIKKACELLYEQEISDVKIIVKKQRKRAFKGQFFIRADVKKAMIKFKNKEVIDQLFGGKQ